MSNPALLSIQIACANGDIKRFSPIKDFQLNIEHGLVTTHLDDGIATFLLDRLRYFRLGLQPQNQKITFHFCRVILTPVAGNAQTGVEELEVKEVIGYEWKPDQGLLMVFGQEETLGVHLDHLISYQLDKVVS